jgi:predicted 3-demethylubiquinone-9 3-methyltransferase (glyoxalase superfamily)
MSNLITCLWFEHGQAHKPTAAKRATAAMMTMRRIDIAAIEAARR